MPILENKNAEDDCENYSLFHVLVLERETRRGRQRGRGNKETTIKILSYFELKSSLGSP